MVTRSKLESLYKAMNRREYVRPDPLQCLYPYESLHDREIAALIASSLAYGRVNLIVRAVASVLDTMSPSPARFLGHTSPEAIMRIFSHFKYRFTTGEALTALLVGAKRIREIYGSLYACFLEGLEAHHSTVLPALCIFAEAMAASCGGALGHVLPSPKRGSACKRLNLFLRWMVRRDAVDPGGWEEVPLSKLVIPVDTHMHRVCRGFRFTNRSHADLRTAMEITDGFRGIAPEDPVKYDFTLTRLAMRGDPDLATLIQ